MKFEYNANLVFDERVQMVVNEIKNSYPNITDEDAYAVAVLDSPIDDKSTNDDKFFRYYLIMRILGKNNSEFMNVFKDMYELFNRGLKSQKNKRAIIEIVNYVIGDRNSFPELVPE